MHGSGKIFARQTGGAAKKKELLFASKKKQKNFDFLEVAATPLPRPYQAKVFCFVFSKKKVLLSYVALARAATRSRQACRFW
jgi:hypothetical protein